jgi:hypothetical protein
MSYGDPPVRDSELRQLRGNELTRTAMEIGEEQVCEDIHAFGDFLGLREGERKWSDYFGEISDWGLQRVILNAASTGEQIAAAAREIRSRYLAEKDERVRELAAKAMRA